MTAKDPPSIKVCDFGVSKQHSDALIFTNTDSKTLSYAAPERLRLDTSRDDDHVDCKVDLWALGCVIAELVTGRVLFENGTSIDTFCRSLHTRKATLSILDNELSTEGTAFIRELLQPNPESRPSARTALEMSWLCNTSARLTPPTAPKARRDGRSEYIFTATKVGDIAEVN